MKANPQMHVEVKHEADFIEDGVKQLHRILDFVSYFVGCIMAAAATLGAANSLYAVVDQRRRDIATLRALGFRSSPIVAAILTESTLLAVP
ncbi:ABC transporter permease, partial [Acinetobacter baumannii]